MMLPVVGARFQKAGRMYFFDPNGHDLRVNDWVIVKTDLGLDAARVQLLPSDSPLVHVDPLMGEVVRKAPRALLPDRAEHEPAVAPVGLPGAEASVVDAPERGLEALAERDDGPARMPHEEGSDLVVERTGPQTLPLRPARALTQALREGVVDSRDELDGERVVQHRVGARCLLRPVVERPEQGLRNSGQPGRDPDGLGHRLSLRRRRRCL